MAPVGKHYSNWGLAPAKGGVWAAGVLGHPKTDSLSAQLPRRPGALHRVHRNTSINSDPEESLTDRLNRRKN